MILITYLFTFLFSWFIFVLAARYPGETIVAISDFILGKWLGRCVSLCLIIMLIFGAATSVRFESDIVVIYLLVHTPLPIIILTMLLSVMYVINTGMGTIARLNELIQPIIFLLILVLLLMMLPKADFTHFLPLISEDFSWKRPLDLRYIQIFFYFQFRFLSIFRPTETTVARYVLGCSHHLLEEFAFVRVYYCNIRHCGNQLSSVSQYGFDPYH